MNENEKVNFTHRTTRQLPWEKKGRGFRVRKYQKYYDEVDKTPFVWNIFTVDNKEHDPIQVAASLYGYFETDGFKAETTTCGRQFAIRVIDVIDASDRKAKAKKSK